ncbi:hypothetical protein [Streptomyces sp. KR80]|jgi:hypothetical protein|uniref:hypothetical protein n=1 Tax=Streptomyces sp. KR80 TaxID=3457426 RepID=UPI003FCF7D57
MLFLVAAFLLLGILIGAAAHLPLPAVLAAASAIGGWLIAFGVRERLAHGRDH